MKPNRSKLMLDAVAAMAAMQQNRPLVTAVCRRYLRGNTSNIDADVEDAVQETLLRYLKFGPGQPIDSLPAWLTRVAQSVCLDMNRHRSAHSRKISATRLVMPTDSGDIDPGSWRTLDAAITHLPPAMAQLNDADQRLIAERFIANVPLRVIAERSTQSIATASRRVMNALRRLAAALRDRGVAVADESLLGELFADRGYAYSRDVTEQDVWLRTMANRQQLERRLRQVFGDQGGPALIDLPAPPIVGPLWPGWTRPIRVGVMISYDTIITPGYRNTWMPGAMQVDSSVLLNDPRFELIAVIEPRTSLFGPVERTIRDFDLLDGLIEADDGEALATLDVLYVGINNVLSLNILRQIHRVVSEHAVGWFKDGWLSYQLLERFPAFACELMLARAPIYPYHMPGRCGLPTLADVKVYSPLLGLSVGSRIAVSGCAPAFEPLAGARVIVQQRRRITAQEHGIPGTDTLPIPMYLTGTIGRARAVVSTMAGHAVAHRKQLPTNYLPELMAWLAEPRRLLE